MTHTYIRPTGAGTEEITARAIVHYANGSDATIRSLKLIMINDEYTTISISTFKHELISLGKNNTRDVTKREQIELSANEVRAITVIESIGSTALKTVVFHIHPNTLVNVDIGLKSNKPSHETLSDVLKSSARDLQGFKRCVSLLTADNEEQTWSAYSNEEMPEEQNNYVVLSEDTMYNVYPYNNRSANNIQLSLAVKENLSITGTSGNTFYTNGNI